MRLNLHLVDKIWSITPHLGHRSKAALLDPSPFDNNDKLKVSTKTLHVFSSVITGSVWVSEWLSPHGSVLTGLQGHGRQPVRRQELHRCGDISRLLLQVILVLVISNCPSHHR